MAFAGYNALVYVAHPDDATAFADEATSAFSGTGDATVRQITDSAKRLVHYDSADLVVVKDGSTTLTLGSDYKFDYLYGRVAFQTYTPSGSITVSGDYLPVNIVGTAKKWTHRTSVTLREITTFHATDTFVKRMATLVDANITLERFDFGGKDYGASADIRFNDILAAGTVIIADLCVNEVSRIRMRTVLESDEHTADVTDIVQSAFNGALSAAGDSNSLASLSFGDFYWGT